MSLYFCGDWKTGILKPQSLTYNGSLGHKNHATMNTIKDTESQHVENTESIEAEKTAIQRIQVSVSEQAQIRRKVQSSPID